jgi:hypothetical protein
MKKFVGIGIQYYECSKCRGTLAVTVSYRDWARVKVWGGKDFIGKCLHCGRSSVVALV